VSDEPQPPMGDRDTREQRLALTVYQFAVIAPVLVGLTAWAVRYHFDFGDPSLFFWAMAIALVDLMPVPAWGGLQLSLAFPIRFAVALIYAPPLAAIVALVGSIEPREIHRTVSLRDAIFNHCQMAATVLAEAAVFHSLASSTSPWQRLMPAVVLAALTGYMVNMLIIAFTARLATGIPLKQILARMHGVAPYQFFLSYFVLGLSGVVIVKFYNDLGPWSVAVFLAALVFARHMYFQSRALADRLAEQNELLADQARRLEELLATEQANVAELRELNRMKNEFVAVVSHELRTPLTAIIGFAKTLRRQEFAEDPTTRTEFLQAMERQGDRLLRLVENLLTVSRVESDKLSISRTRISFHDLCSEIVEAHAAQGERIRVDLAPALPVLHTDRDLLGRVLSNLIDNALKYSPDGAPCEVGARAESGSLIFWVKDEGIGISLEEAKRIFDRFYQVDSSSTRAFRGAGLGLSLVKELLDKLGGTIEVKSLLGRGSTFTVRMPVEESAEWVPKRDAAAVSPHRERQPVRPLLRQIASADRPAEASSFADPHSAALSS
jgi:signal transduction histidine kinase